ncbi:hypothetical protein L218DRAFT_882641 [Marasmius fiardii PR-910]|nr:hypothetical protein L218DRAFT_882641 [Marasmius fiardii PR-910]
MLTSGRVRSHAFGMLVDGPNVQLQYYDRSIILRTRGISLFDQDERRLFLAALYRFTQFAPVDWGILLNADEEDLGMSTKHEIEKKSRVDPLAGMEFTLEKDGTRKRIRLVCLIFRSHGVIGRGTIVAEAVCICGGSGCGCDWGGSLVVKISFPATSRVMEYELVSEALNKAVGEHVWVKNHLPRILWAQNISFGEDTPQEQLAKLFPDKYEERHVCITVQRKLQPIHDLVTPEEFAQVFYDILQCHRWLYVIPKILHRDISLNNIMFWRNPTTREVYGVLNDFDLSSRVAEDRTASSKQRTGTKPYMAHDLFDDEWVLGHLYRHDLESIFYVLLCLCSRYKGPGEHVDVLKDQRPPYERWFTEGYEVVRAMKIALFSDDSSKITNEITDFFRNFKVWAVGIHDCISRGFAYRQWARTDKNPFDHHTLGGQFTYATVSPIMSHFDGFQLKTRSTVSLD